MAQDTSAPPVTAPGNADPVTQPLPALPGPPGNPEAVTGSAADALPVPLTLAERARLAVAGWAATAASAVRQLWLHPDRVLHSLWHPEPETMAEHRAYIRSRAWVPPGLDGRPAAVIAWAGIVYHILIGHPLKASMKAAVKAAQNIDRAAERPLRIFMFAVFISALVLILLNH